MTEIYKKHIRAIKDFIYNELLPKSKKYPEYENICAQKMLAALDCLTGVKKNLIEVYEIINSQKPTYGE